MLPDFDEDLISDDYEEEEEPTLTYRMDINKDRVFGKTDELDAMKQAVYKMLLTERYQYIIYSWDYGVELKDLIGMPVDYCESEIKRRVKEALVMDERITDVTDFSFETGKHLVHAYFTVHTVFGDFDTDKEVAI